MKVQVKKQRKHLRILERKMRGMKVKVYRVVPKENQNGVFYMVDAPSKRIAKWCGANLFNNEYIDFLSAKDMIAERFRVKGGEPERDI